MHSVLLIKFKVTYRSLNSNVITNYQIRTVDYVKLITLFVLKGKTCNNKNKQANKQAAANLIKYYWITVEKNMPLVEI